jgi:hypothetical protein
VPLSDAEQVVDGLADASIAALSVGQQGLPAAIPLIDCSLKLRSKKYEKWSPDLIIVENMLFLRDISDNLFRHIYLIVNNINLIFP